MQAAFLKITKRCRHCGMPQTRLIRSPTSAKFGIYCHRYLDSKDLTPGSNIALIISF
jgi:hypothetical protein